MSLARDWLPVCGQDFPCGPRDSQAAPKENNYSDRREKCVRSQTCGIGKRERVEEVKFLPTTISSHHCCLFVCLLSSAEPVFICGC